MTAITRKKDAAEISKFLKGLAEQRWVKSTSRSWWPRFLFHHTDVRNAVEILKQEKLYCRSELERQGHMVVDNASPQIVAKTHEDVKGCVRLYFRPKTPTEYRSEGMRPKSQRELGAHCPMPVFFLFKSDELLTRKDCQFSNGNLAAFGTPLLSTAAELAALDFKRIYHVGRIADQDRTIITHRRNAEVIIKKELDLSALEYIFCRSPAEKETLVFSIPKRISSRWKKKILVESKSDLFHRKWTFLETVELTDSQLTLHFSPDSRTPGPFDLEIKILDLITGAVHPHNERTNVSGIRRFRFRRKFSHYRVNITLDGDVAYKNEYLKKDDIPF